jgi:hypothetical protein
MKNAKPRMQNAKCGKTPPDLLRCLMASALLATMKFESPLFILAFNFAFCILGFAFFISSLSADSAPLRGNSIISVAITSSIQEEDA